MEHDVGQVVLVTGATGAIGPSVARAFLTEGYRVRTLALAAPLPATLPNEVSLVVGDVSDPEAVASAMQGASLVIHLAALLHVATHQKHLRERYEQINVKGTATVVRAAIDAGVQRVVFFSTIAVYGGSQGGILTEHSFPHPDSVYAQTKLDAERILLDARRRDGQPLGTILRLAAVYGPRMKGNYRRLVLSLARGRFIPVGRGTNRRTLVYDSDVARAALLVARHPAAPGRIYNVTDGRYHTMEEIIRVVCDVLGRQPPRVCLPVGPARCAAGLVEAMALLARLKLPIGRATIDKYTEDMAVSGERVQRELGFKPEYDLARGWAETIRELRQMGEL